MIELLTDVTRLERIDYPNEDMLASGVQGSWGFINAAGNLQLTSGTASTSARGNVFCVWTEQKRTNASYPTVTAATEKTAFTPAFTPDTTMTRQVTVLNGKYRARTSQYITDFGAPAAGDPLCTWSGGQLRKGTLGTHPIIAYCLKGEEAYEYLGTNYMVITMAVI